MKIISKAILMAVAFGAAPAVQAAEGRDSVTFKLRASELESPEGIEKLLDRLQSKAKLACFGRIYSPHFEAQTSTECRENIASQWIDAIGSPALTEQARKDDAEF